ncbi:MAG: glycoside hydrolase family 3 N-terminal domain-containing protein [Lachnospiraceae bacterium]|nr:beta-glucosidase [Robinsoniella sp.]MDY3765255.1 glycoside hydrolase family 3 N-terminal domain-containing protein [Lachnospiraceae bacterium]
MKRSEKRRMRKAASVLLTATMAAASLSSMAFAGEASAKYEVVETEYGYNKVVQDGGKTLSYSPTSGVALLEDDGFAFKDLNQNGQLDTYEDWRLDTATRAQALADMMVADGRDGIESIAGLMLYSAHTKVSSETVSGTEIDSRARTQDGTTTLDAITTNKLRHVLVTSITSPEIGAKWSNNLQAIVEGMEYGIPCNNSSDPRHAASTDTSVQYVAGESGSISQWPGYLGLAATYDPELVKEFGEIVAVEYRALGIGTALSPQIDLASEPRWSRVSGTFGENVALTADLSKAIVDGHQSTYDEDGNDLGWGEDSIVAMIKHWPSGGPEEGGRDGHYGFGKYAVYPGDDFGDQIKNFASALDLDGATGMASAVMPYYTISYNQSPDGTNVGNGFSNYMINELLRGEYNFDGVCCTDWMITADADNDAVFQGKCWGVEDKTVAERHYECLMAGMDQFGGNNVIGPVMEAYDMMVERQGQTFADERFAESAVRLLTNIFNLGLFEDPYLDPEESTAIVGSPEHMEAGYEAQLKSVVMLKNKDNIISEYDESAEKKTVYVPTYTTTTKDAATLVETAVTSPSVKVQFLQQYFNVTENPEEADFAIIGMSSPDAGTGYSTADLEAGGNGYVPISLQYREYTADTARETAIANDPGKQFIDSETGEMVYTDEVANRSYRGKSITTKNEYMLDVLEETKELMGDKPVIVYMRESKPMVWSEVEPLADAIIVGYSISDQAAVEIIAGVTEPSGLLPMQQPANMETVEAQCEDVPMDMECYVDSEGNTYDVAYGLNWSGVIDDERVAKYGPKAE